MISPLAYAQPTDQSGTGVVVIMMAATAIAVAAAVAFVPVAIAWRRRHRRADLILAVAIVWAALAAGSVIVTVSKQMDWSKERTLRIESGYYDPNDTTAAPPWPWTTWGALGGVYAAWAVWSCSGQGHSLPRNVD
jgi:hypothetical protein